MTDLTGLTLVETLQGLQGGDFSSEELTQAYLQRIDEVNPEVQAYLSLNPERSLDAARLADEKIRQRKTTPREKDPDLLGVPIAVKDVLCVEGYPCTCGSKILEGFHPPYNATAVQRLIDSGAFVLGKTNTDEFAMGSSTENSAYGTTHNPWNLARVPGGSSGGSAAAVAARMTPVALGTDTGGSVRQPASFCGVTGIKPTYGRVSRYGLVAYGSSLDVVGVLGQNARDVQLVYSLIAGYDPLDATSQELPLPVPFLDPETAIRGVRVGVPGEYFVAGIQPRVQEAIMAGIAVLEGLGAEVHEISLPHTEYALPVYYLIAPAEASANLARYDGIRYGPRQPAEAMWDVIKETRGTRFGPEVKRRIMLGTYALSAGYYEAFYGQAQKVRTLIKRDFEQAFRNVDVIAAPVAPTTAFAIGEHRDDPLAMYLEDVFTLPANLAGVPGLAFPVGFDGDGLPIGMQLMGPHYQEETLFRVGHAYQSATDWHRRSPSLN